ncbi:TfoX/Sxy family protein [Flavobacteriaceae bacterium 3-367]
MGTKGDKLNQEATLAAEALVAKLNGIDGITSKKMFGGHGIFHHGKMFGIVNSKGQSFLKANAFNKVDFEKSGSHKHGKMPYFSIPDAIANDTDKLVEWANKALKTIKSES